MNRLLICLLLLIPSLVCAKPGALYLDGKSYASLPADITKGLRKGTVECWVKWEAFNKWSRVFDFGREGNAVVLQNEKKSGKLHFAIWDKQGNKHRVTANNKVKRGEWHHLAASSDGQTLLLYIDGMKVAEGGSKLTDLLVDTSLVSVGSFADAYPGNNYIGRSNWKDDELFGGYIADFRVWGTIRTESEIARNYRAQLMGDEQGLRGYWRFENGAERGVADETRNGRSAELFGSAAILDGAGPEIQTTVTYRVARQTAYNAALAEGKAKIEAGDLTGAITTLSSLAVGYDGYTEAQELVKDARSRLNEIAMEKEEKVAEALAQKRREEDEARKRAAESSARKLKLETLTHTYHEKYDPTIVIDDMKRFGFAGHLIRITMQIHELAVKHPNKSRLRMRVVFDRENKYGEEAKHDLGVYEVSDLATVRRYVGSDKYVYNSREIFSVGRFLNRAGYTKDD